ncbi:MAG TPA: hypothetical protein VGJ07_19285 [Rugosimonospora sp.]
MTEPFNAGPVPQPPAVPQPAPQPAPKSRLLRWVIVAAVVVVVLGVGTPILVSRLKTDSGVAACRVAAKPATAANTQPAVARATNRTSRGQFAGSRYADLRTAGGHYVDAMDNMLTPYGGQTKPGVESVPRAWAELTQACGHHGVTLKPFTP